MALSIKDSETEKLVRTLAERRGTGVTGAIRLAVANELARDDEARAAEKERRLRAIREIQRRFAALPVTDDRSPDEIIGYDENGLPT